ncbi:MAG: hypothetical protein H0T91_10480 [Propionibacteriaceae bacterium]|nr:hypothetical protein [Propionibacteriaceae bacterium]
MDSISDEAWYDILVMARLRYPYGEEGSEEGTEDQRRHFIEEFIDDYQRTFDHSLSMFEEDASFDPPDPVLNELLRTARDLAEISTYLDKLMVFARAFAAETSTTRVIADVTGVSHSTVVRTATPELVARVAAQAQQVAEMQMKGVEPVKNPVFYRRLVGLAAAEPTPAPVD